MKFRDWYYHPAAWWQFWYPQSGLIGGLIIAILVLLLIASTGLGQEPLTREQLNDQHRIEMERQKHKPITLSDLSRFLQEFDDTVLVKNGHTPPNGARLIWREKCPDCNSLYVVSRLENASPMEVLRAFEQWLMGE